MALIYQTTDIISVSNAVTTLTTPAMANGDTFYVTRDVSVVSTGADAFNIATADTITSYNWIIDGHVVGDNYGIFI